MHHLHDETDTDCSHCTRVEMDMHPAPETYYPTCKCLDTFVEHVDCTPDSLDESSMKSPPTVDASAIDHLLRPHDHSSSKKLAAPPAFDKIVHLSTCGA